MSLFDNAGKKVRVFGFVLFIIGLVSSAITWLILIIYSLKKGEDYFIWLAFSVLVVGSIVSWLLGLFISAFGQLVENSQKLADAEETKGNLNRLY